MTPLQAIAQLPDDFVEALAADAPASNPAAVWLSDIFYAEAARRAGRPAPPVLPLELEPGEVVPALAWLDLAGEKFAEQYITTRAPAWAHLGALIGLIRTAIEQRARTEPRH